MTDALADRSRQNNGLLAKLDELDCDVLDHIAEDPELANELMADGISGRRIAETAMLALRANPIIAEQFREVFKLDYFTLVTINARIGIDLEEVTWYMFENNITGILQLLTEWNVPSATMKDFALGYFFRSQKAPNPAMWARVMEVTGLSGADIQGYCEEQFRRAVRDGLIKDTGNRVAAALIVKVNGGAPSPDAPTVTPTAEA